MKFKYRMGLCALALALVLSLGACAEKKTPAALSASSGAGYRYADNGKDVKKYTKEDYDLALSLRTEGYEKRTVADFDRSVMNWEDETEFHKREEQLDRLLATLPREDENAGFIFGTLAVSVNTGEKKHYNACKENRAPYYDGWVTMETKGDVFGDPVVLYGAYVDFSFNYSVQDEAVLTVGERDSLLKQVETVIRDFLGGKDKASLKKEEETEKALKAVYSGLLQGLKDQIQWEKDSYISYYYSENFPYIEDMAVTEAVSGNWETGVKPTDFQEQYDLALKALKPAGWEDMSIAAFNRGTNAALRSYEQLDGEDGKTPYAAYELVQSMIGETDPNYRFFTETVANSIKEYDAKAQELAADKLVDPRVDSSVTAQLTKDVFGDDVVTGQGEGSYSFTYRILDSDNLTVQERDNFLAAVRADMQKRLEDALKTGDMTKEQFKAALEEVGENASTNEIAFTGCEVEYFEIYR